MIFHLGVNPIIPLKSFTIVLRDAESPYQTQRNIQGASGRAYLVPLLMVVRCRVLPLQHRRDRTDGIASRSTPWRVGCSTLGSSVTSEGGRRHSTGDNKVTNDWHRCASTRQE